MTRQEEYKNALNGYMNLDVHINKTLRLIGISAIKKQIPKKPILKEPLNYAIWTKKTGCCPICNSFVSALGNYHHCKYCGQAIDWSEEE
jgi:hypothetical protein